MSGPAQGQSYWVISTDDYGALETFVNNLDASDPYKTLLQEILSEFSLTHSQFPGYKFMDPSVVEPNEASLLLLLSDPDESPFDDEVFPSIGTWVWVLSTNPIHQGY